MKITKEGLFLALSLCIAKLSYAQSPIITDTKVLDAGACENQQMSGTCWSFSGMSFFQAELLRKGKFKNLNLSEMFVVRNLYPMKAANYVRMHGKANFGEGGEFTDDLLCLRNFGLMPQSAYNGVQGLAYNHITLAKKLDSIATKAAKTENILDLKWKTDFQNALVAGLGSAPEEFEYEGKTYTPKSFAEATGLKADDYILLSSYTHHPYYSQHVLEVPDNWNWEKVYNVPMEELSNITRSALDQGYTVAWGADVSGTFNPQSKVQTLKISGGKETQATAEARQKGFETFENQDDHAMHIVGLAKDEKGNTYFKVKNSWGKAVAAGEYFYTSPAYLQMMTTSIMVNKNALSKSLRKKLGIS